MEQELLTLMTPMEILWRGWLSPERCGLDLTCAIRTRRNMWTSDCGNFKKTASKQTGFNIFNWLRSFFTSLCGRRKC